MFTRIQTFPGRGQESAFLWGARQTGKSTLLRATYADAVYYDLLLSDEFIRLTQKPFLLRQELLSLPERKRKLVIIDEVQKIPVLLPRHYNSENPVHRFVPSFQRRPKRRVITAPKFYFLMWVLLIRYLSAAC